ncbi:NUDIX domain-containing protein [Paenibacillus anseongense]|uniref:NUDIX domain-containing protein n=1 Tax=Paenibacillus anseongense TaxID=2682845 RepID=UPI002DB7D63E|nr:NUDIX domain-containing protein [Paenibacillus anseongense]MEC0269703.1 NUDIX domain-containing protein [Paenibacillus anseongense]
MIRVAAAIIENEDGLLLIARRRPEKSHGRLWEFPGGKIEEGEFSKRAEGRDEH